MKKSLRKKIKIQGKRSLHNLLFLLLFLNCRLLALDPYSLHETGSYETNLKAATSLTEHAQKSFDEGNYKEALNLFYKALIYDPTYPEAHFGLALSYEKQNQNDEALREFNSTLIFSPGFTSAYIKLASLYFAQKKPDDAFKTYFKALSVNPAFSITNDKKVEVNHRREEEIKALQLALSVDNLKDKVLYIYSDVDLPTALLFSRYLPKIKEKCPKLLFEPPKNTLELFESSFNDIQMVDWLALEEDIHFDLKAPFGALPFIFDAIIETKEILKAPAKDIEEFKSLVTDKPKRVGIAWSPGGSLALFANLPSEYTYYSLQTQKDTPEISELIDDFDSIEELAGAISDLDLVISYNNTIALLAASLGKQTWLLLGENPEWMWQGSTDNSPWFSNVTLFPTPSSLELKQKLAKP